MGRNDAYDTKSDYAAHSQKRTRSGKADFLIVLRGVGGIAFPEICSHLLFPEFLRR